MGGPRTKRQPNSPRSASEETAFATPAAGDLLHEGFTELSFGSPAGIALAQWIASACYFPVAGRFFLQLSACGGLSHFS
jgi:hypothetical protein